MKAIRYNPTHTYTEEQACSIADRLTAAEQQFSKGERFTFVPYCAGEDCYKVAVYDAGKFVVYF